MEERKDNRYTIIVFVIIAVLLISLVIFSVPLPNSLGGNECKDSNSGQQCCPLP